VGRTRLLGLIAGEVKHSAEGYRRAMLDILDGPAEKSWTFSVYVTGVPDQHYPLEDTTWAAGSPGANVPYVQLEHEGRVGEALTSAQLWYTVRISAAIRAVTLAGRSAPTRRLNLWEHNECVARYGGGATACPSGRIPWSDVIREVDALEHIAAPEPAPVPQQEADMIVIQPEDRPEVYVLATGRHIRDHVEYSAMRSACEAAGGVWRHASLPWAHPIWRRIGDQAGLFVIPVTS